MNKNWLVGLICCFLTFSCDEQPIFNQFQTIENGLWEKEQALVFSFEIEDIDSPYHITLEVRNNNLYPFQNLWLSLQEFHPDSLSHKDTLSITLADPYGRWSGSGISLFETEYPLYTSHYFHTPGTYSYTFKHLMYKEPLPGIQNIGVKIEKIFR